MLHSVLSNQLPESIQVIKKLKFSQNWNNKLSCNSFSTVRLWNSKKYQLIDVYQIILQRSVTGQFVDFGYARLQSISSFFLDKVSPAVTFLDANLDTIEFIQLIKIMYKNKNINWNYQKLGFYVFQFLTPAETMELQERL